jgi:hypothetical protein
MFCPRCAAQNADDAKFCRACGTDISLVPQAVTGQLAERLNREDDDSRGGRRRRRHGKNRPPTIERAVERFFTGVAFIFVAFAVRTWAPAGNIWWFWMFIPAAGLLAEGVSTYLRLQEEKKRLAPPAYVPAQTAVPPPPRASALPPRDTGEIVPPPSITEGTTRHLNVPAERTRDES